MFRTESFEQGLAPKDTLNDGLSGALIGVSVVNFALNLPGPLAAQRLSQLGAEVTKVEPPSGDAFAHYARDWYATMCSGHEVVQLDLKSQQGKDAAEELLTGADVAITSFRPSALERMGLGNLAERFPGLIHIDIVGDVDSPETPGHDLTYQAQAGTLTPPAMPPVLLGDILGAEHAVTATLAALVRRGGRGVVKRGEGEGAGAHIRVGLKQAGESGALPVRYGLTSTGGLLGGGHWTYGIYETADGYVAVAALEPHFAKALSQATGATGREELESYLARRTTDEITALAQEAGLPISAVR